MFKLFLSILDAFSEQGRPSLGDEAAIPPNATLYVHLQFLSWVRLRHTWEDRTISKKNLSAGNSLRIHTKSQGVVKGTPFTKKYMVFDLFHSWFSLCEFDHNFISLRDYESTFRKKMEGN